MRCVSKLYRWWNGSDRRGTVVLVHSSGHVLGDGDSDLVFDSIEDARSFVARFGCEADAYRCVDAVSLNAA
jgi:hypothetical protein